MSIQVQIKKGWASKGEKPFGEVILNESEAPEFQARIALALIERWGLVAGLPDGEDSSGRSRLRKATPAELVEEACDVAERAVGAFKVRGWMCAIPNEDEVAQILIDREKKKLEIEKAA